MGQGNVEGKGDKAQGSGVQRKKKEKGRMEPQRGGREEMEPEAQGEGLEPKSGKGNLRPISTSNMGGQKPLLCVAER